MGRQVRHSYRAMDRISWTGPVAAPCPSCAGPWLYSLTFRHELACPLLEAEDATRAADWSDPARRVRVATPTEIALAAALGWTPHPQDDQVSGPAEPDVITTLVAGGHRYRRRLVNETSSTGFDPNLKENRP